MRRSNPICKDDSNETKRLVILKTIKNRENSPTKLNQNCKARTLK